MSNNLFDAENLLDRLAQIEGAVAKPRPKIDYANLITRDLYMPQVLSFIEAHPNLKHLVVVATFQAAKRLVDTLKSPEYKRKAVFYPASQMVHALELIHSNDFDVMITTKQSIMSGWHAPSGSNWGYSSTTQLNPTMALQFLMRDRNTKFGKPPPCCVFFDAPSLNVHAEWKFKVGDRIKQLPFANFIHPEHIHRIQMRVLNPDNGERYYLFYDTQAQEGGGGTLVEPAIVVERSCEVIPL